MDGLYGDSAPQPESFSQTDLPSVKIDTGTEGGFVTYHFTLPVGPEMPIGEVIHMLLQKDSKIFVTIAGKKRQLKLEDL